MITANVSGASAQMAGVQTAGAETSCFAGLGLVRVPSFYLDRLMHVAEII